MAFQPTHLGNVHGLVAGGTRATRLDVNSTTGALAMSVNPDDLQDAGTVGTSIFTKHW